MPIVAQELQSSELLKFSWYPGGEKNPSDGLTNADMPFITHITGECTKGSRLVLLQSEGHYKGSQTKGAWVQVAQTYV